MSVRVTNTKNGKYGFVDKVTLYTTKSGIAEFFDGDVYITGNEKELKETITVLNSGERQTVLSIYYEVV